VPTGIRYHQLFYVANKESETFSSLRIISDSEHTKKGGQVK
jgi:hypothetical protein